MDTNLARSVISTIQLERDRRIACLPAENADAAEAQWQFFDVPFIAELCLMVMVATRHHVERELVWLAARLTQGGRELTGNEYEQRIQEEREQLRSREGWKELSRKLKLADTAEWGHSMNTLRLLSNSYKHSPWSIPDKDLLEHLSLDADAPYAPLPESPALCRALAEHLGLPDGADYCDIAEEFLARVEKFLAEVESRVSPAAVKRGPMSMNPDDFLR